MREEGSRERGKQGEEKGRCYRQAEEGNMCPERNTKVAKWHRTLDPMATFSKGCEGDLSNY